MRRFIFFLCFISCLTCISFSAHAISVVWDIQGTVDESWYGHNVWAGSEFALKVVIDSDNPWSSRFWGLGEGVGNIQYYVPDEIQLTVAGDIKMFDEVQLGVISTAYANDGHDGIDIWMRNEIAGGDDEQFYVRADYPESTFEVQTFTSGLFMPRFPVEVLHTSDAVELGGVYLSGDDVLYQHNGSVYVVENTEPLLISKFESGPVPEPATMLLLGSGLVGLAVIGRKRFKK